MPKLQRSYEQLTRERTISLTPDRTATARTYRYLGRQPRLRDLPRRRPPYLEAAIVAAAFMFLLYLVLGGG
jgi:hypothetical protein